MSKFLSREKMAGKQVIDAEGMIVGNVKDIAVDIQSKEIAFKIATRAGTEIDVVSDDVSQVGDVILLKKALELPEVSEAAVATPTRAPGVCPSCGYANDPASKFCIKCGTLMK
jgi:sporulation protein YlmC with PRC-barrel domain